MVFHLLLAVIFVWFFSLVLFPGIRNLKRQKNKFLENINTKCQTNPNFLKVSKNQYTYSINLFIPETYSKKFFRSICCKQHKIEISVSSTFFLEITLGVVIVCNNSINKKKYNKVSVSTVLFTFKKKKLNF